jgi:hydroxymethylbilane synthase
MIRLATRASELALAQARAVADALSARGARVEVVPMRTEGDRLADARLAAVGGKGLFVREIEAALLRGDADVAVHSLKDLPAEQPAGLCLAAFPERADARDVLVTRDAVRFCDLSAGAVIGTSSPRRCALVLGVRPDLTVQPIRGNVDTRLRKLEQGGFDGIVLAAAGLERLGITPPHAEPLSPDVFVPAVGQGVLAVEARADDRATLDALRALDHTPTRACALAERAFLRRLGASCVTPMAAHARTVAAGRLRLDGVVASEDGRTVLRESMDDVAEAAGALGVRVANALLARGAADVVALRPAEAGHER